MALGAASIWSEVDCARNYYEVSEMEAHVFMVAALITSVALLGGCGDDGPDAPSAQSVGAEFRVLPADQNAVGTHREEQNPAMHDEGEAGHGEPAAEMHAGPDEGDAAGDEQPTEMHDEDDAGHDEQATEMHDEDDTATAETAEMDQNVVEIEMVEFGFVPSVPTVPVGEPVVFRFVNTGAVPHEAMFGSLHEQSEFAGSQGHGEHGESSHHGEVAAITLGAGETGEMVLEFAAPGEVWIGCHLPGHYDAGMKAALTIA